MTKLLSALFLLLAFHFSLHAQRAIDISYESDAKGNYTFYGTNHMFCNYILNVNFTTLENARCDHALPFRTAIAPGRMKLFVLSKLVADTTITFKYGVAFNRGCISVQPDTAYTYLLPYAVGKESQAYVMESGERQLEGQSIKNWYVIRLRMKPGDTIYASRNGMVTEVEDQNGQNDLGQASAGHENYIEVNHKDCSFGHYGIVKKGGSFVRPGQTVVAGQALGLVGGDQFGRGSEIRFSVYYNTREDDVYEWRYLPLLFWVKGQGRAPLVQGMEYVCEKPAAQLKQEAKKTAPVRKKPAHK